MRLFLTLLAGLTLSSAAFADECDCSRHLGACTATATLEAPEQRIGFQGSSSQCEQIIYSLDGQPSSVTIRGGSGSADYLVTNPDASHSVSVDSCSVCAEPAASPSPPNKRVEIIDKACGNACSATYYSAVPQCELGDGYRECVQRAMAQEKQCFDSCAVN